MKNKVTGKTVLSLILIFLGTEFNFTSKCCPMSYLCSAPVYQSVSQ